MISKNNASWLRGALCPLGALWVAVALASAAPGDVFEFTRNIAHTNNGAGGSVSLDFVRVGHEHNDFASPANTSYDPGDYPYAFVQGRVNYVYGIGKYPITVKQWNAVAGAAGLKRGAGDNKTSGDDEPVNYVSWKSAAKFCNWLTTGDTQRGVYSSYDDDAEEWRFSDVADRSFRNKEGMVYVLPTEDEWYKAAYYDPATKTYALYGTGKDSITGTEANARASGRGRPTKVGTLEVETHLASPFGAYDMAGNVRDWIEPWIVATGMGWYDAVEADRRSARGGSFAHQAVNLSASDRGQMDPAAEYATVGFRVVALLADAPPKAVIPAPKRYFAGEGIFELDEPIALNSLAADGLSDASVRKALEDRVAVAEKSFDAPPAEGLRLIIADPKCASDSPEAYRLKVERRRITVTGRTADGVLMGLRTLAQLALDGPIPQCEIVDWPDMRLRGTHFTYCHVRETMAYNVPDFEALLKQIDLMAAMKQNAALIELTALFPYKKHPKIPCEIAFTPEQIATLRDRLRLLHVQPIPMIQCLGHVYYVLMHPGYEGYAELPPGTRGWTQQYCPTNPKVLDLFLEFADEQLAAFPETSLFHIGGDESRLLGRCDRCRKKVEEVGVSRLYVDHVGQVAKRLLERGVQPVVWSDMLQTHPEAIDALPEQLGVHYWDYWLPAVRPGRPYGAPLFLDQGKRTIAGPGVRFGRRGHEFSVHYTAPLAGLETLAQWGYRDGVRETICTNWMKGSPHELTHYGLVYAAELAWNVDARRADFQRRYARVNHGLDDPAVLQVHVDLSFPLPYSEAVDAHRAHRLDRLDLSGDKFPQKWSRYTNPSNEPGALKQLEHGLAAAVGAKPVLEKYLAQATRGHRELELLLLAAECVEAKARLALALHEGKDLLAAGEQADPKQRKQWLDRHDGILKAWDAAKVNHREMLMTSGFPPVIENLSEMFFAPAERAFFVEMGRDIQRQIAATAARQAVGESR